MFLATEALFVVALYITKASVLSTVERVLGPEDKKRRMVCWIVQGVTGLCGLASLVVVLVSCDATSLLTVDRSSQCSGQVFHKSAVLMIFAGLTRTDRTMDRNHHPRRRNGSVHIRHILLLRVWPADERQYEDDNHLVISIQTWVRRQLSSLLILYCCLTIISIKQLHCLRSSPHHLHHRLRQQRPPRHRRRRRARLAAAQPRLLANCSPPDRTEGFPPVLRHQLRQRSNLPPLAQRRQQVQSKAALGQELQVGRPNMG